MREIFKTIKENFILLFGTGLFTYGLFSFDSSYYLGKTGIELLLDAFETRSYPITIYYYYSQTSLILLTIGVIFIVIGLLKMRKRKGEN